MTDPEINVHVLDAAYKPFPTFAAWAAKATVDTVRWDRYAAELKSRQPASSEALKRAYEVVKRAAALDTGAIEGLYEVDRGFTFTVALETAAWEVELAKKGKHVRSLFEAQMQAYDYVLDLATKAEPITEAAIRRLHEVVCEAQSTYRVMTAIGPQEQELEKGRYKVLPNHVRTRDGLDHSYAPVDVTPAEMARLVGEMRSAAFLAAQPVNQAAYAHYGLVVIHPFADGNGRVARALASAFTYRAISMPIMILSEHKSAYLDALEVADHGNFQTFVDFLLARSVDTILVAQESMRGAGSPTPEESLAAIDAFNRTNDGLTDQEVDEAGLKLLTLVESEVRKQIARTPSKWITGEAGVKNEIQAGYPITHRPTQNVGQNLHVLFFSLQVLPSSDNPLPRAAASRQYDLLVPKKRGGSDEIFLRRTKGEDTFVARMDELLPIVSPVLQIRIEIFARRVIAETLADLRSVMEPLV